LDTQPIVTEGVCLRNSHYSVL